MDWAHASLAEDLILLHQLPCALLRLYCIASCNLEETFPFCLSVHSSSDNDVKFFSTPTHLRHAVCTVDSERYYCGWKAYFMLVFVREEAKKVLQ